MSRAIINKKIIGLGIFIVLAGAYIFLIPTAQADVVSDCLAQPGMSWVNATLTKGGYCAPTSNAQQVSTSFNTLQAGDTEAACTARGGKWFRHQISNGFQSGCDVPLGQNAPGATGVGRLSAEAYGDFGCTLSNISGSKGGEAFATCIASIVYYIGPGLASWMAYIGAYFFSYAVALSLNSVAYALEFIGQGWEVVRDLANMAFLLILVYIAYTIMLKAETANTLKMLAWVVFMALIINFSFFFTRLVIDAGNILAVQFYNTIPTVVMEGPGGVPQQSTFGVTGVKDLSASIMNAVKLQSLWGQQSFDAAKQAAGNSVTGGLIVVSVVYLAVAAMFWILFFVFLHVGIKFIMRIVVLWFAIIASPLAFAARAVPKESFTKFYSQWQDALIRFSFYPAIFLFMFLIILKFLNQMLASGGNNNIMGSIFGSIQTTGVAGANAANNIGMAGAIANASIRMGLIVAMFYIALKASDWIVSQGSNLATTITSRGLQGGFAATGLFGRATLGGAGSLFSRGVIGRNLATSDYRVLRGAWRGARFLSQRSYDARAIPGLRQSTNVLSRTDLRNAGADIGGANSASYDSLRRGADARVQRRTDAVEADRRALQTGIRDAEIAGLIERITDPARGVNTLSPGEQDRLRRMNARQVEALSTDQIVPIAHILNQNQLQAIERSQHHTEAEKEQIMTAWNTRGTRNAPLNGQYGANAAPINRADRIVEEVARLQTIVNDAALNIAAGARVTGQNITNAIHTMENHLSQASTRLQATRSRHDQAIESFTERLREAEDAMHAAQTAANAGDAAEEARLQAEEARHRAQAAQHDADAVRLQNEMAQHDAEVRNVNYLIQQYRDLNTVRQEIPAHVSHANNAQVPAQEFDTR